MFEIMDVFIYYVYIYFYLSLLIIIYYIKYNSLSIGQSGIRTLYEAFQREIYSLLSLTTWLSTQLRDYSQSFCGCVSKQFMFSVLKLTQYHLSHHILVYLHSFIVLGTRSLCVSFSPQLKWVICVTFLYFWNVLLRSIIC